MILEKICSTGIEPVELTERDRRMARKAKGMIGWADSLSIGDVYVADSFTACKNVTVDGVQVYGACNPHTDEHWRGKLFTTITVQARRSEYFAWNDMGYPRVYAIGQRGKLSSCVAASYTAFVLDPMRTHWMHMLRPVQWRAVQVLHPRTMTPREALDIACDWAESQ